MGVGLGVATTNTRCRIFLPIFNPTSLFLAESRAGYWGHTLKLVKHRKTCFFDPKIPPKKPLKRPPKGTLGVAKCQYLKIQCFPSHQNWLWIWNCSKTHRNTLESSVVKYHLNKYLAENGTPLKKGSSQSQRSKSSSGVYHSMRNFHLSPFPKKFSLENFSTSTK